MYQDMENNTVIWKECTAIDYDYDNFSFTIEWNDDKKRMMEREREVWEVCEAVNFKEDKKGEETSWRVKY